MLESYNVTSKDFFVAMLYTYSYNTHSKLTCTHHLVMAFHTFFIRQTNLKSTSSVLFVKQG